MSFCVNIKSPQFKETAKRLDISEGQLEEIAHKYMNSEGTENQFPSDEYIMRQVSGQPDAQASESEVKLWKERYSKPQTFNTMVEYAKKLSSEFKFVRVDFYEVNGEIYLGELTFTPGVCYFKYKKHEDEIMIGNMLKI